MGKIQSWSCCFLLLALPIFYTFSTIHFFLSYTFAFVHGFTVPHYIHTYSLMLTLWKIMLFSSLCYHQTQLLVCNPLPAAGWFMSLDTSMPAWAHLLSFQTGPFLCCILSLHFPRFFGVIFLYLTLWC